MLGRPTWLVISMAGLALAVPSSYAADTNKEARAGVQHSAVAATEAAVKLERVFEVDFRDPTTAVLPPGFQRSQRGEHWASQWKDGELTLAEPCGLLRPVRCGPLAEFTASLRFPALTEEGARSETRLGLVTTNWAMSIVALSRARTGAKTTSQIRILSWRRNQLNPNVPLVVRRIFLKRELADGLWTIRYEHGLVCVSCNGEPLADAFPGDPGTCVIGVSWDQERGSASCRLLRLAAVAMPRPPSADQRKLLDEAHDLNETGNRLYQRGRIGEALVPTMKALKMYQAVLGDTAADTANSLGNVATLLERNGDHHEAEVQWLRALGTYSKALGETHPATAGIRMKLALLLASTGRSAEAERYLGEAMPVYSRVFDTDDATMATATALLATMRRASKRQPPPAQSQAPGP